MRNKVVKHDFTDHSGGGDGPMDGRFVTKNELNSVNKDLSHKIDLLEAHLDTKFEKVHNNSLSQEISLHRWFIGTDISIIGVLIALHFI